MSKPNPWIACLAVAALSACGRGDAPAVPPPEGTLSPAVAPPQARVLAWMLPTPDGAAQPDLAVAPDGRLLLSWIEAAGRGHRLQLASAAPVATTTWSGVQTVASGDDWFVNWADTPRVHALPDGSLWAHWLRNTGPSRMDYGIALVRSVDGGAHWSGPLPVHPPGTRGDHGFVSYWTQDAGRLGIAWLDSRQKAAADAHDMHDGHDDGHGSGPAMMLRAAIHGPQGTQEEEWPLDVSTCDCCTTSAAMTARGVVVVYRGRSAGEVRDTRIVRLEGGQWTAPRDVHADGWRFAGCPVNGPAVVAEGNRAWVAWYTEADGVPELRAARSDDAGDSFGAPVTLAKGPQVLGRLALALGDGHLMAAWLEEATPASQTLVLGRYDADGSPAGRADVAGLSARGRASGMPRLQWSGDAAWLAWTEVRGGTPVLRGASVRWTAR